MQEISFQDDLRKAIVKGMDSLTDLVKLTYGPSGRNVLLQGKEGDYQFVNSGQAILSLFDFEDRKQNIASHLMKDVALKTYDQVKDGSTTALILTHAMVSEGYKQMASGANPVLLKKGMQGAGQLALAAIGKMATPLKSEELEAFAISLAPNKAVGHMIVEAIEALGPEGLIKSEETPSFQSHLQIEKGMHFDRGYLSSHMLKQEGSSKVVYKSPLILTTDLKISHAKALLPLLEKVKASGRALIIIGEEVSGEALNLVIANHLKGTIQCIPVRPPAYGKGRIERLKDLAVYTGGTFVSASEGSRLEDLDLQMLGTCQSIEIDAHKTVMTGGGGNPTDIERHCRYLEMMLKRADYPFDQDQLKERLSKFVSGVAIIKLGAQTEMEMKALKAQSDSAIFTVKNALQEGVVAGGGVTYLKIMPALKAYADALEGDMKLGVLIVMKALRQPFIQLVNNTGRDGQVILTQIEKTPRFMGFDVIKGERVDMRQKGLLDSAKVIKVALENAVSASGMLLSTEVGLIQSLGVSQETNQ